MTLASLWAHFGQQMASRGVFLQGQNWNEKGANQVAPSSPRRSEIGGVPLNQWEAGGWRLETGGWRRHKVPTVICPNRKNCANSVCVYMYVHWLTPKHDLGRTGCVNGTIRYAYFKHRFRPKTSIPESLGVILAILSSILVALGSPGTPKGNPTRKNKFGELFPLPFWHPF